MASTETVLITGASSGIGFELTRCFGRDSYRIVLVARHEDDLQDNAEKLKTEFHECQTIIIPCDLSKPEGPSQLYEATRRQGLQIDVLLNNAGIKE